MPLLPVVKLYFICMSVFSVYMHVCVPWMLAEDVRSLRTRAAVDCELLCGCWGTEHGSSLREEFLTILNVFLTAEPSLKCQDFFFKVCGHEFLEWLEDRSRSG